MSSRHHEVPAHLNVEDKVLFGLTVRQFLFVLVGCSAAYTAWDQLSTAAFGTRVIAAGMCAAVALAFALLRPAGRALEEWLVAALLFATSPRLATWRPRSQTLPTGARSRPPGKSSPQAPSGRMRRKDESRIGPDRARCHRGHSGRSGRVARWRVPRRPRGRWHGQSVRR